jgi:hypothetical protein
MIEPRPYSHILRDTYCPGDQNIGCDSCGNDSECLIRLHDDEKCWELPNFGLTCEICHKIEMQDEGDKADWLYEQEKDIRMMEGEE